jgi:hypothetical protein
VFVVNSLLKSLDLNQPIGDLPMTEFQDVSPTFGQRCRRILLEVFYELIQTIHRWLEERQMTLTVMSQTLDTPVDESTFGYRRGIPPRSRWDWRSDAVPNMTLWPHLEPPTAARSAHGNLTDPRELASTGADIGGPEACGAMGIPLRLILASTF